MLDGRHTGTGGGNHVTLGGTTPSDSPLLRRPDLLRSLITYWQHHPGLSSLFSGHVHRSDQPGAAGGRGPRRQPLRAGDRLPADARGRSHRSPGWWTGCCAICWSTSTGNTHRAEFCIDKLYSPDSATGRLGLVEFRAFEMPPHARMSLVQMLLLRTLIARFWKKPYRHTLVRWGTVTARPLHAAALRLERHAGRGRRSAACRLRLPARLAGAVPGIPLPALRCGHRPGHSPRAERGPRTLARAGRGNEQPVRRAMSTPRWNACRSRSPD